MKISDVEKTTGLTAKAIRLYEKEGLISVNRGSNLYRDYSESEVELLREMLPIEKSTINVFSYCTIYARINRMFPA